MMLPLSMFFLICGLSSGVFGFGAGAAPAWLLGRALFFVCLTAAFGLMVYAVRVRPVGWARVERKKRFYF